MVISPQPTPTDKSDDEAAGLGALAALAVCGVVVALGVGVYFAVCKGSAAAGKGFEAAGAPAVVGEPIYAPSSAFDDAQIADSSQVHAQVDEIFHSMTHDDVMNLSTFFDRTATQDILDQFNTGSVEDTVLNESFSNFLDKTKTQDLRRGV